jgi:large subunit ribosomal protein L22
MEAIAKTRHLKGSPRKARLVIDLIRGRNVSQALNILKFTDKRAADPIAKTLRSAIANATYKAEQENIAIDPDDLWVKTCFVDMGAHKNRRRMRPAPQGRAYREQRHYCHITILVSSEENPNVKEIKESKKGKEGDKSAGEKPKKETKKAKTAETPVEEAAPSATENTPVETSEARETAATETTAAASETTSQETPVEQEAADAGAETSTETENTEAATDETPAEGSEETDKK